MVLAIQVHNASQDWHSSKLVVAISSFFSLVKTMKQDCSLDMFGLFFFSENNKTELISGHKEALKNAKHNCFLAL